MTKEDLKDGMIVEYRIGEKRLYANNKLYGEKFQIQFENFDKSYQNDLKTKSGIKNFDIMKVYDNENSLLWERKEEIKLTQFERDLLNNLDKKYKYIIRDSDDNLRLFIIKPNKSDRGSNWVILDYLMGIILPYLNYFQFIKWEDKEPYLISDLLGGE